MGKVQKTEEFKKYLQRKGKKSHVVDDLVKRCEFFEEFLHKRKKTSIDDADEDDLMVFLMQLKSKTRM